MKNGRQKIILEIISNEYIETQAQLIEALSARGIVATQATLSRDIRDLQLVKEIYDTGKYRYVVSHKKRNDPQYDKFLAVLKQSVTSVDYAGNIVVIKTLEAMASGVASALDKMKFENIVGSLAGDDTIFLAMRTPEAAAEFLSDLKNL